MKRLNLGYFAILLVLIALSACSDSGEHPSSSNANAAPPQANNNSAAQPQVAQANPPDVAPNPSTPSVQPMPPPAPAAKSAPDSNAGMNAAKAPDAGGATRAPKLVAPEKKIDFGKQPQDKSLVRAIVIKNGGRADLKIDSVAPS